MSVQRKMRVSLGTSAWVCFIVKPQPRAGATLCLCYRQVKCCTLWWGLRSGLKWESIGLQGSVFFGLLLFVLWSFLGALKLDIDSLMRNMKLLESFIIFFEVCIAILCNLQQFFLLSGFFFWWKRKAAVHLQNIRMNVFVLCPASCLSRWHSLCRVSHTGQ